MEVPRAWAYFAPALEQFVKKNTIEIRIFYKTCRTTGIGGQNIDESCRYSEKKQALSMPRI